MPAPRGPYVDRVIETALDRAGLVIDEVFKRLDVPKPDQEELRARFKAILDAPDDVTYQQEYAKWVAELGQQEWNHQMQLVIRGAQQKYGPQGGG